MTTELVGHVTTWKSNGPDGYFDSCNYCSEQIHGLDLAEQEQAACAHFVEKHIADLRDHAKWLLNLADEFQAKK